MNNTIISYCCGTWPNTGGVARYDTQLKLIFPNRIFFQGPQQKEKMLIYAKKCLNPIIITDNHLACDIPNTYPVLLVHHGCALTTSERNPTWDKYWKDLCCNGQKKMLYHREQRKTWIISISKSCTEDFTRFYPDLYPKFNRIDICHPSELDESVYLKKFNTRPIILGNWSNIKKGQHLIPTLRKLLPNFEFKQLNIRPYTNESLKSFNKRKQEIYISSDIFLQIANSEGFSYASNDAMLCGLVPVCTTVGGFGGNVSSDSFVPLDWEKCYDNIDYDYLVGKITYAWENKEILSKNSRKWYMEKNNFSVWKNKMYNLLSDFNEKQYKCS